MTRFRTSSNPSISLPYEGMDLKTPLAMLPATRAPYIQNFFINGQTLQVRYGTEPYSEWVGALTNLGGAVYNKADGTQEFFGLYGQGSSNDIINYSSNPAVLATATAPQAIGGGPAYFLQYKTILYSLYFGGTPVQYNGTTWGSFGFTGPTVTTLKAGNVYRNRVYLVEGNSTKVWYGNVDSTSGAMTSFDIGSILTQGGSLSNVYPISYGDSSTANQYLAFVTTTGEVLFYQGAYPGSPDWSIVTTAIIGPPLSPRTFVFFQGDVLLCTTVGLVSLRDILKIGSNAGLYATISQPIDPYWRQLIRQIGNTSPYGGEFVRCVCGYSPITGCIYIYFYGDLTRENNQITGFEFGDEVPGIVFVYNTIAGAWTFYKFSKFPTASSTMPAIFSGFYEFKGKVLALVYNSPGVIEIEKPEVFRDSFTNSVVGEIAITASILSSAFISPVSGGVTKVDAMSIYGYFGASTSSALSCALIENFGVSKSRTSRPQIIINSFNQQKIQVGSTAPYVQYSLGVETSGTEGEATTLYSMNILKEDGGY